MCIIESIIKCSHKICCDCKLLQVCAAWGIKDERHHTSIFPDPKMNGCIGQVFIQSIGKELFMAHMLTLMSGRIMQNTCFSLCALLDKPTEQISSSSLQPSFSSDITNNGFPASRSY